MKKWIDIEGWNLSNNELHVINYNFPTSLKI